MQPNLNRVIRLDSIPLPEAYFTSEGYLIDRPILTSTGIFEYIKPDGSVRYELRLPEEVFAEESLASYQGKPVIITHEAEYVTKDNVQSEAIGTILSKGYQDGSDVRAQIIIHDTDAMKECGLRELSLGYDLDLEETPGEWNGQHYDAIQRNIRINHLALVRDARAGDQARLHIDSRDNKSILKGGKAMKKIQQTERTAFSLPMNLNRLLRSTRNAARHVVPKRLTKEKNLRKSLLSALSPKFLTPITTRLRTVKKKLRASLLFLLPTKRPNPTQMLRKRLILSRTAETAETSRETPRPLKKRTVLSLIRTRTLIPSLTLSTLCLPKENLTPQSPTTATIRRKHPHLLIPPSL